jgi:hypothetical protein
VVFTCEVKVKNIFLLYMAPGNYEQMVHYEDTIKNKVSLERVFPYVSTQLSKHLLNVFMDKKVAVWGSRDTSSNRAKFERMSPGDEILIIEGDTVKLLGIIAGKTINSELSRELWKNLKGNITAGWNLIYFIANSQEIELPFQKVKELFNYEDNYQLRGFTSIADERLKTFYKQYDNLYSILEAIKQGKDIKKRSEDIPEYEEVKEIPVETEYSPESEISAHTLMQWKLATLGIKASSRVWLPKSDQKKIQQKYGFKDYETEFTAGIDLPIKYVKNIDVVWKKEYQIDAAFEVENSTSIYSGLLRFADLKILTPNHRFPFFIVSPSERKNRVLEQVKRPSFKSLSVTKDVKFLSYENIEEIDGFFQDSKTGLTVDVLVNKSETFED